MHGAGRERRREQLDTLAARGGEAGAVRVLAPGAPAEELDGGGQGGAMLIEAV